MSATADSQLVYLDNNATTKVAPEVVAAMLPFLTDHWFNPSSAYRAAGPVAEAIAAARQAVAALVNADEREIIFTSCGTESNNTALMSALLSQPGRKHVVTSAVEHSANIKFGQHLERRGHRVTWLPVEPDGTLDICKLSDAIRDDTAVVSLMWANNETGVLFPIDEVAAICRSRGVLFHTDAVQVAGKLPIDVRSTGVDMLSLSAHKISAPKGIGALYIRQRAPFAPYIIGGQQELGRRGGTQNVPHIAAFGKAAELALARQREDALRLGRLRDRMEESILRSIPGARRNGNRSLRLPNTSNLAFSGVEAEAVLLLLDQAGVCASSGSACTTGSLHPSHVLTAMGLREELANGSIRLSLGHDTTDAEIDHLLAVLPGIVARLRAAVPPPEPAHTRA